eukprot:5792184-Alexandrium_andersonii.AAC.1
MAEALRAHEAVPCVPRVWLRLGQCWPTTKARALSQPVRPGTPPLESGGCACSVGALRRDRGAVDGPGGSMQLPTLCGPHQQTSV